MQNNMINGARFDSDSLTGDIGEDAQVSSWAPVDLGAMLDGKITDEPPALLAREDGPRLIYAGLISGIIGESESGKTWIGLEAVRQALDDGDHVIYLDFEDSARGILSRLTTLQVPPDQIRTQLAYMQPDSKPTLDEYLALLQLVKDRNPALIICDGLGAALNLFGYDQNDNGDVTAMFRLWLKPLTQLGAAVVYIDHTPKTRPGATPSRGAIGAQIKRGLTRGVSLRCSILAPFGRGVDGIIKLKVDKDSLGYVRGISKGDDVGLAQVHSDSVTGDMKIEIRPPTPDATMGQPQARKLEPLAVQVSTFIASNQGCTKRQIRAEVKGRAETIGQVIDELMAGGWVTYSMSRYHSLREFTADDSLSDSVINDDDM
jgi:hypothetical protein